MTPQRANIFLIGTEYAIINRKMYRLEELDDEGIAEMMNGGNSLPICTQ